MVAVCIQLRKSFFIHIGLLTRVSRTSVCRYTNTPWRSHTKTDFSLQFFSFAIFFPLLYCCCYFIVFHATTIKFRKFSLNCIYKYMYRFGNIYYHFFSSEFFDRLFSRGEAIVASVEKRKHNFSVRNIT